MGKGYFLILSSIILALIGILSVTANHGGTLSRPISNPAGFSSLTWIIFAFIIILIVAFFIWLFSKGKKKF